MHINYTFFTKTKIQKYALSSKKQYRNGGSSEEIEEVSYLNPSASHIAAFSSLRSHITASSVSTLSSRRLPLFRGLKVKLSFTTLSLGSVTSSSRLTADSLCARLRTLLLKALCLLMGKQTVGKHIQCEARDVDREFLLQMSYMEIYNEEINDLLAPEHQKLQIHESLERGIYVAGLREEIVASPKQVLDLMEFGECNLFFGLHDKIKLVPINLQNSPAWYKEKVYPENKVPALEHNGKIIGESLDLIKYVDSNFEGPSLLSHDHAKKEFAEELFAYSDPFTKTVYTSFKGDTLKEAGLAFDHLEKALHKFDDGPFFLGQFSLVDIAFIPFVERFQIAFSAQWNYDITAGRPKLAKWIEEVNKIDAYKVTKTDPKELVELYKACFLLKI
ncbi:glutathione S-transferase L3-like isoform X2 [Fagus crenata]